MLSHLTFPTMPTLFVLFCKIIFAVLFRFHYNNNKTTVKPKQPFTVLICSFISECFFKTLFLHSSVCLE